MLDIRRIQPKGGAFLLAKVQSGAVLGIDAYIVKAELNVSEGRVPLMKRALGDVHRGGAEVAEILATDKTQRRAKS